MDFVVDFYKGLDALNLIIFWGVIIVVILLLIFSIVIANKNRKLKQILLSKKNESTESNKQEEKEMDLPIKRQPETIPVTEIKNEELKKSEEVLKETITSKEVEKTIEEEKKFIAEEHVMEYNKDLFSLSNIKKANEYKEEKNNYEEPVQNKEIKMPTGPYQRNVLREMSLSQTSPIGIVKKENKEEKEINKAKELQEILLLESEEEPIIKEKSNGQLKMQNPRENNEQIIEKNTSLELKNNNYENKYNERKFIDEKQAFDNKEKPYNKVKENVENKVTEVSNYKVESYIESVKPIIDNNSKNFEKNMDNTEKERYLEEVSKKLSQAQELDDIDRTEYELKQEEEAIISYEELMQKKDSIKMIDEEEAIISIEELLQRKAQKEKLYNLTEEEENDEFINELKNFRSDL